MIACLVLLVALAVFADRARPSDVHVPIPGASGDAAQSPAVHLLTVHVVGAVASPGVFELPMGARVADAIAAAGGPAPDAELTSINLARSMSDGEQVRVAHLGDTTAHGADSGLVSLNQADAAALEDLPGIGPVLAERIVKDREAHGPFASVEDLDRVSGVGPAVLERVRDYVTV